jgi:prolyl-tRNA editing enzyme YbaK/EbsC (Cys-tRNA(Pro) deacylase)
MSTILHESVAAAVADYDLAVQELACDPDFADTAAFNDKYGFLPEQGANTLIVASKKGEPTQYVVCVVLASTRLDVNKAVTNLMGVKKASFADSETTIRLSGMEIGGVTAVGVPSLPIYVDSRVFEQETVVMGGGNRTSKVVLDPSELLKLPNVTRVDDLAKLIES